MKRVLFSALLATALISAPAMARDTGIKYYGSLNNLGTQLNTTQGYDYRIVTLNRTDIKNIQLDLRDRGFKVGAIDGIVGPQTRKAVKDFQYVRRLPVTGKLDRVTLSELRHSSWRHYGFRHQSRFY